MIGDIKHFRFWCQKVLPLVYDNSLSYYEVLCKVSAKLNELINNVNDIPEYIDAKIEEAFDDDHILELLSQFITKIQSAISANNEGTNVNSSKDYNVGQMLWLNDTLYRVIRPISAGATFIVDTNIEAVDFETLFNDFIDEVKHDITANDDGTSATATHSWTAGQWLWLNDVLYEVVSDITQGNAYVFSGDNANVRQITVEDMMIKEATARENADTTLAGDISDEATARENADTALQQSITNINNKIIKWVNVVANGADNTGNTDCSSVIQQLLNDGATELYFPNGMYLINDTITFNNNCEIHLDVKAKIITTENVDVLFDILPTYGLEDYNDVFGYKRFILHGGIIDGNGNVGTVLKIGYALNSHIVDCKIRGFTDYGIKIEHGAGNLIDNVQIYGEEANYGYYGNVDGVLRNVTVTDCHTCFSSSFDSYERCSGWIAKTSLVSGSICFENRNHSVYSNCVSDTVQYGWVNSTNAVALLSNCSAINNDGVVTPTADFYLFYTSTGVSSFYVNNFIVLLSTYTVTNTPDRPDRISIFNMTGTGGNLLPKNTLNGDLLSVITSGVNVTSDIVDNFTTTKAMLGYFTANAAGNTSAGWGIIICMRTHNPSSYLPQMAQFALVNNVLHTRFNDGTEWTAWS